MWIDKSAIEDTTISFKQERDPQLIVEEVEVNDSEVLKWVRENCTPEEVFGIPTLELWAECHDYVPDPNSL